MPTARAPRSPACATLPTDCSRRCSTAIAFGAWWGRGAGSRPSIAAASAARALGSSLRENSKSFALLHLFPLMKRLPFPKSAIARRHAFEHPGHRDEKRSTDSDSSSRAEIIVLRDAASKSPSMFLTASWARSRAISAAPIAPIRWADSGRMASTPQTFSNARSTALDLNAPPCTTI